LHTNSCAHQLQRSFDAESRVRAELVRASSQRTRVSHAAAHRVIDRTRELVKVEISRCDVEQRPKRCGYPEAIVLLEVVRRDVGTVEHDSLVMLTKPWRNRQLHADGVDVPELVH
jgi:hypothetical protein